MPAPRPRPAAETPSHYDIMSTLAEMRGEFSARFDDVLGRLDRGDGRAKDIEDGMTTVLQRVTRVETIVEDLKKRPPGYTPRPKRKIGWKGWLGIAGAAIPVLGGLSAAYQFLAGLLGAIGQYLSGQPHP